MNGFHKLGFTLIELVVGLAIIGLLASISIPTIRSFLKKDERSLFLDGLNSLISNALDNAILSGKNTRVVFDFISKKVFIEQEQDTKLKTGEFAYEKVESGYVQTQFDFSKMNFEVKNFFIDSKDEMVLAIGQVKKEKVWFFILPDGTSQSVILNILELDPELSKSDMEFSFVLNPFSVQFKEYEKFMQPS